MTLPILLSIPHGGTQVPPEVADRVCITARDLFDDIDPCTKALYDVGPAVAAVVSTPIARTFVDMNRDAHDRPPDNPDGVVKTVTCHGRPIYHEHLALTPDLTEALIQRYHAAYHERLERAARHPGLRLGLDCHTMLARPPAIAPDRDAARPPFCLSNGEGATCPMDLLEALAEAIAAAFECDREDVALNRPFTGGYITRRHGAGPLPWIQVEMNRSWYLAEPWHDRDALTVDPSRLDDLRGRFLRALQQIPI